MNKEQIKNLHESYKNEIIKKTNVKENMEEKRKSLVKKIEFDFYNMFEKEKNHTHDHEITIYRNELFDSYFGKCRSLVDQLKEKSNLIGTIEYHENIFRNCSLKWTPFYFFRPNYIPQRPNKWTRQKHHYNNILYNYGYEHIRR